MGLSRVSLLFVLDQKLRDEILRLVGDVRKCFVFEIIIGSIDIRVSVVVTLAHERTQTG